MQFFSLFLHRKEGLMNELIKGLSIPFLGTALGSACVFLMRKSFSMSVQRVLTGC